jgi:hypothetical protein
MEGTSFDEAGFFRAIHASGARALLIGRRALVAPGLPVVTADYDFWIHPDDVCRFDDAVGPQAEDIRLLEIFRDRRRDG